MALKRSRSAEFPAYADEPDMSILISGVDQPLPADYHVLRQYSTTETSPVTADTVQRWLDLVYCHVDAARRVRRIADLDKARPLLAFADAIGASRVIIDDIERRLADNPDHLGLSVTVGEGQQQLTIKLALRGAVYYIVVSLFEVRGDLRKVVVDGNIFAPHAAAFPSAVCSALESWLHLAGRLGMVQLCRILLGFVKAQMLPSENSVVLPAFASIFSQRVFDCMPRELLLEALVRDSLVDQPGQVLVEAEKGKVTLGTPIAASWFAKHMGATESMVLGGGNFTLAPTAHMQTCSWAAHLPTRYPAVSCGMCPRRYLRRPTDVGGRGVAAP